ncbi:uncharacterized protein LOC127286104 [Leptopilina boulardi]|uniref:uncharacterized protein LOC127286104 n=1 Tax=Leptopilina boulardi TaxID=63433 RepID=UPI0021F611EF|nr:uncharacterized protein LOC127286104 [Leptopilina boulardi]
MLETILFTPPLQGEIIESFKFPKGDIAEINYPKGILEEITAEYNIDKPNYSVIIQTGLKFNKLWQVKCTVTDTKHGNVFTAISDEIITIRESEHCAALKILKELNRVYYFSEEEKQKNIKGRVHVMAINEPNKIKLKMFKWESCCEYCYKRGHTKNNCHGILRNKKIQKQEEKEIKDSEESIDSDEFWNLPGPSVTWE